jgi:hypothetical protein
MVALDIVGIQVPDTRPVFLAALGVHLAAGATAVIAGALAAASRKRAGRHPHAGTVYLWALATVFVTAAVMAGMRWRQDAHLFAIATAALTLGLVGWRARRRHRPGWVRRHAIGVGGSYIALLTGFYVDNGPQLPVWDRLPHLTYWLLPTAVGAPLIWLTLHRFHSGVNAGPSAGPRTVVRR